MDVTKLSLEEKIGQKFMFGVTSSNIDIIINLIKKYYIGGVILYKKNYRNYNEMLEVIKKLKDANKDNKIPLFISIDQEGGRVNRMPSEINNIKNIYDMSKKDIKLIGENGNLVGKMLSSIGINMNFAPVMDVCENNKSKILFNRCFYGDEDNVYKCGSLYSKKLRDNKVIPVIKHFPGHGVSTLDSHIFTPIVLNNKKIFDKHIIPFNNMINAGVDAIMVGHLVIKGLTNGLPASMSSNFINKYLRENSKFNGIVITDEVNMLSRNLLYRFCLDKMIFKSDSDIILYKLRENSKVKIMDKYVSFIKNNNEYMDKLDNSVKRILDVKKKFKVNDDTKDLGLDIDLLNKEICKINSCC